MRTLSVSCFFSHLDWGFVVNKRQAKEKKRKKFWSVNLEVFFEVKENNLPEIWRENWSEEIWRDFWSHKSKLLSEHW